MNLKKSLLSIVTAGAIAMSLTGCGDSIDGTYTCDSRQGTVLIKVDGDKFDLNMNNEWFIQKAMERIDAEKKKDPTLEMSYDLVQDSSTKVYTASANGVEKGKKVNNNLLTFSIKEDGNMKFLTMSGNNVSEKYSTCTKNK